MAREIIYQADVILEGVTPMLHHKCGSMEKKVQNAETDYSKEWRKTTYINDKGNVIIPSINIEAMLCAAGTGYKIGKSTMKKVVASGIDIDPFEPELFYNGKRITLDDIETNEWIFAASAVVQRARVVRVRTQIPIGWTVSFSVKVKNSLLKEDVLKDLVERAGYEAGIGDWRPQKNGKFGQFDVVKFDVS